MAAIGIDMMNLNITIEVIGVIKEFTEDERVDKDIREHYKDKLLKITDEYDSRNK